MPTNRILVIDNHRNRSQSLKMLLEFMDFEVLTFSSIAAAELPVDNIDLVIFGNKNTTHILDDVRSLSRFLPQTPFLLLQGESPLPLELLKSQFPLCLGIYPEPFKQETFLQLVDDVLAFNIATSPHKTSADTPAHRAEKKSEVADRTIAEMPDQQDTRQQNDYLDQHLIGNSKAMLKVKKLIRQVANSNANVLILGESGTGKEVVARCIHQLSKRRDHAYVPVNCGAIPADLLESELFGHEKGAFTGAISARQGRFELAQGGTLFLDEIVDMPLPMQVKILRILQEKMFERVGGNKSIEADVRILAATHRDLEQKVADGSFREDLFYRLNVFPIEIPPLKERVEDIPLLVDFINRSIQQERDESVVFSDEAMASLFYHPWPGNIRELSNLIERMAIIYNSETIGISDLPEKYQYNIDDFDFSLLHRKAVSLPDSDMKQENEQSGQSRNDMQAGEASVDKKQDIAQNTDVDEQKVVIKSPADSYFDAVDEDSFDLKAHLGNLEQTLIEDALAKSHGVVAHAAKRLNIRRTTLVEKMKKYNITIR